MLQVLTLEELQSLMNQKRNDEEKFTSYVEAILREIRSSGIEAVLRYTERFDGIKLTKEQLKVSEKEFAAAYQQVDQDYIETINMAADRIREFHEKQKRVSWLEKDKDGNMLGQMYKPIERVGIYVPGGTAAYPSSVLMNAIPALVAGVQDIIMVTPPAKDGTVNPYTLVAAKEIGVTAVYKVGGAQAIGFLAYGDKDIAPVHKITGPGNIFVTLAKKLVYGVVDIDMLAGPSEILIIADENANPRYVAADLLSQAEHDTLASSILVTSSEILVQKVQDELATQLQKLSRREIAKRSLKDYGAVILTKDINEAIYISNSYAPEHLELLVDNPLDLLPKIKNAGAIFLGANSPEPVGDYFAGPNHILPTGGTARFYSPVSVDTFMKKSSIIYYTEDNLKKWGPKIIDLAQIEGLDAHANSVKVRLE
ncbi:MAG: histidinol dehydrogenase [Desulfitibacter sp. BRH_c19]|nr:MAG: histidinol dehydrogenase [Desulfitibacter sp. BRH_c19]